jgi:YD repeat-containing protein
MICRASLLVALAFGTGRTAVAQWCPLQTTTYDEMGRVVSVTDGLTTTSMTYDSLGRKTQIVDGDMGTWNYAYDNNGNVTSQTDARGATINMTYDALNRITLKNLPYWNGSTWVSSVAAPLGDGEEDIVYEYDGQLTPGCPGNCNDHCSSTQDICNAATGTCTHTGPPCTGSNGYGSDCTPSCSGTACGSSDGCFGTCCAGSGCTPAPCSSCQTPNACGSACVNNANGSSCTTSSGFTGSCQSGACVCTPSCSGKSCGSSDGCGGTCCTGSGCGALSCPICQTLNSCGSACVATSGGTVCTTSSGFNGSCQGGACVCTPNCSGQPCGSPDGCGGTCCTGSGCTAQTCGNCQTASTTCGGTCNNLPSTTVCSAASGCLQAAYCTGTSASCPAPSPVADGTTCTASSGSGTCFAGSCTADKALFQSLSTGTLYTGISWNYTMGYQVTPNTPITVTDLGGYFSGTNPVYLYNRSTGAVLASATVTSANAWAYVRLTSRVSMAANAPYSIGVNLPGTGGVEDYPATLPTSNSDAAINGTCYRYASSAEPCSYSGLIAGAMYGLADLKYTKTAGCTQSCTGKTCGSPDGCGGTCCLGSGCMAQTCPTGACGGNSATCGGTCFLQPSTTQCAAATTCANAAYCTGSSAACPAPVYLPSTTVCIAGTSCANASYCTGSSAACPAQTFLPPSTVCASATSCASASQCTGSSPLCPAQTLSANGAACTTPRGSSSTCQSGFCGSTNALYQPLAGGTQYLNVFNSYVMGYGFTPNKNIVVTHLGGLFNGTQSAYLYNRTTGSVLASVTATSANTWAYAPLASPVTLTANASYSAGIWLGTGPTAPGAYFSGVSLPVSNADATVNGSCYRYGSTAEPCAYSGVITSTMYGVADVRYELPCAPTCSGTSCGSSDGCGGTCCNGSGCTPLVCPTCENVNSCGSACVAASNGIGCSGPVTALYQPLAKGTLYLGSGNYTEGYALTPNKPINVTQLGGIFNGTGTAYLFNRSTGAVLTSTAITSTSNWAYATLPTPVALSPNGNYSVAVSSPTTSAYFAGAGTFPVSNADVTIGGTCWRYNSTAEPCVSSGVLNNEDMYGVADLKYTMAGSCEAGSCVCVPNCSGKSCGSPDGCGGTCCFGSGCTAVTCPTCQAMNACESACVWVANGPSCTTASGASGTCQAGTCLSCPSGSCTTPEPLFQPLAKGTLYQGSGNFTGGYSLTPNKSIHVTHLGGIFNGTETAYLFNQSTGAVLTSINVTSSNNWAYVALPAPVPLAANTNYTVAVSSPTVSSYFVPVGSFPVSNADVTIGGTCWRSNSTAEPCSYSGVLNNNDMYGVADLMYSVP